jgi:hypothetical protein
MAELEHDLRSLAALVELPAERDLWPGVGARLAPTRPGRRWLRAAVAVLVAAALAIGIAFAVPPARSAILRFLGLEGVTIVRVDKLPPAGRGPGAIGRRVTLDRAEHMLAFDPLLPGIGAPDAVYVDPNQMLLTLIYGKHDVRLRITELIAGSPAFTKIVDISQLVERVRIKGRAGYWIAGEHVVSGLFGEPELSASALIWEQLPVTVRIEGRITKAEALRIAGSVRPR